MQLLPNLYQNQYKFFQKPIDKKQKHELSFIIFSSSNLKRQYRNISINSFNKKTSSSIIKLNFHYMNQRI